MIYDSIIIGAGPAGMSAGIYLKNANKNVLIIEKEVPGGKILKAKNIKNYLGFTLNDPSKLAYDMYKQVTELDIPIVMDTVISILDGDVKKVVTKNNTYEAKTIIIATGRIEKSLNIENEEKLIGKGISYCATCDGSLYKNKKIVLIGNNKESIEELNYLKNITKDITYINYDSNDYSDKDINVINSKKVIKINEENDKISSIELDDGTIISLDCLFISTGYAPNGSIFKNLNLNIDNGYLVVDKNYKTNIDGIYAAGDIIKKDLYQIVTAASEGAICATNIIKNLR